LTVELPTKYVEEFTTTLAPTVIIVFDRVEIPIAIDVGVKLAIPLELET
jgi:hypothetical protein